MSEGTVNTGAADIAPDEFVYVEMPDGSVRAVHKDQVQKFSALAEDAAPEDPDPEMYVHLANGEVSRLRLSEMAEKTGTTTPQYLVIGGHAHKVIGIYPVEVKTTSK